MNIPLKLIETHRELHFRCRWGRVLARTLQPSKPHGAWVGNPHIIREWTICPPREATYRECTTKEIIELEKTLGEWKNFAIINHPALGKVSTPTAQ